MISYVYSEIGKYHADKNIENQDSVYIGIENDTTVCIAVADGVSSCMGAKKGSLAAIDTVKHLARAVSEGTLFCEDVDAIRKFVVRDWKEYFEEKWDDYATTLNFAIIYKKYLVLGRIGDGMLLVKNGTINTNLMDFEEFYSTETFALSEVVLKKSFQVVCQEVREPVFIVAMTDGIAKEIEIEKIEELKQALMELVTQNREVIETELCDWVANLNEKNDDDKTIGIVFFIGKTLIN